MTKDKYDKHTEEFNWYNEVDKGEGDKMSGLYRAKTLKPSEDCLNIIAFFEGFRSEAYQDSVGVWTIGYGSTRGVKPGDTITEQAAKERMMRELDEDYAESVKIHVMVPVTQSMFDALCSFVYNVGAGNFVNSSLLRYLNQGEYKKSVDEFDKWVYAGGEMLKGLVNRRKEEAELFVQDGLV